MYRSLGWLPPRSLSFQDLARKGQGWLTLHSQGRLEPQRGQFDVGVDARDFRPVTLDELGPWRPRRRRRPRGTPQCPRR